MPRRKKGTSSKGVDITSQMGFSTGAKRLTGHRSSGRVAYRAAGRRSTRPGEAASAPAVDARTAAIINMRAIDSAPSADHPTIELSLRPTDTRSRGRTGSMPSKCYSLLDAQRNVCPVGAHFDGHPAEGRGDRDIDWRKNSCTTSMTPEDRETRAGKYNNCAQARQNYINHCITDTDKQHLGAINRMKRYSSRCRTGIFYDYDQVQATDAIFVKNALAVLKTSVIPEGIYDKEVGFQPNYNVRDVLIDLERNDNVTLSTEDLTTRPKPDTIKMYGNVPDVNDVKKLLEYYQGVRGKKYYQPIQDVADFLESIPTHNRPHKGVIYEIIRDAAHDTNEPQDSTTDDGWTTVGVSGSTSRPPRMDRKKVNVSINLWLAKNKKSHYYL